MTRVLVGIMAALILGCAGAPAPTDTAGTETGAPTSGPTASPDATTTPTTPTPTVPASPTSVPTEVPTATSDLEALPDPCTLVTAAEAAAAVLAPMADGTHELISTPTLGSGRQCWLRNGSGDDGDVLLSTFPNPGDLWDLYKMERSQFGSLTDLAGVGDKGFTIGNGECVVVDGEVLLEVVMTPADGYETDPEARMIVLCEQAAARL